MSDNNVVWEEDIYCVVLADENYNVLNKETGMVELETTILPEAIMAAQQFSGTMDTIRKEKEEKDKENKDKIVHYPH